MIRTLGLRCAGFVAVVAVLLAAGSQAAQARPLPIALGVNLADAPDQAAPMQDYADLVGRRPSIVMWYQQWSEPLFYSDQLPHVQALGAMPMITWDPTLNGQGIPLSQIASGKYDAYIEAAAKAAAAWGRPMYIRLAHEMNLPDSPFSSSQPGDSPAQFVAAWRHVVSVFRQHGARNVEWVWSPNVNCSGSCPFGAYYPGDNWVDWVALDGYNAGASGDVPWRSFEQVFGSSYAELRALTSKPVMIAETASTSQGGNEAQWITNGFGDLPSAYPAIHAVVWFDRDKETDWRVNSTPATLSAWRAVVASPTYAGTSSTLLSVAPVADDITSATAVEARAARRENASPSARRHRRRRVVRQTRRSHRTRHARRHARHHARRHARHHARRQWRAVRS